MRASEKGQDIFSVNISATKMAEEKDFCHVVSKCYVGKKRVKKKAS